MERAVGLPIESNAMLRRCVPVASVLPVSTWASLSSLGSPHGRQVHHTGSQLPNCQSSQPAGRHDVVVEVTVQVVSASPSGPPAK